MPNVTKADERVHAVVLSKVLLRRVKAVAAARGETMKAWFERAAAEQLERDTNGQVRRPPR